jgi:hypothetical protein
MAGFLVKHTNDAVEQDVVIGQRCVQYEEPPQPQQPDLPDPPPSTPLPPGGTIPPPPPPPCPLNTRTIYYEQFGVYYRTKQYDIPPNSGLNISGCTSVFVPVRVPCSEAGL